ncbi:polysaccharide deacetylase family protein [Nocardiopsis alba]|uniref:polysaccharide deacetylase family protein n=1 Tax=Nocardiopsis alba TaxID=53437 RepID=UPI0033D61453
MMHAGIAWDATGFHVAVVDKFGKIVTPAHGYQADEIQAMIDFLHENGSQAVIDNTNGLLGGQLTAAGITVYRSDHGDPSELPILGSISAEKLARMALRGHPTLTRLAADSGTHFGRDKELSAGYEAGVAALAAQPAPGGFIDHGPRDDARIALTFDDGPFPPYTEKILDILDHYSVPATFFCVGLNSIAHPGLMQRIRDRGHGFGNHTWSHPHLPDLSEPQIIEQLRRTGETISAFTGDSAPPFFRPPYGALPPGPYDWLTTVRATTVLWDVDSKDWSRPGEDAIARLVLDRVRPGSIVLMHDGGEDRSQTVAALPTIIETLLDRDYRLVRVDDLLEGSSSA